MKFKTIMLFIKTTTCILYIMLKAHKYQAEKLRNLVSEY